MFTLWDIKYEDEISKNCCNTYAQFSFDESELDTGLSPVFEKAVEFRNKMNKISDEFLKKFEHVMHEIFGTLEVSLAVPHFKRDSYKDIPSIWFEGIDRDGKKTFGTVCRPMLWSIVLNDSEDEMANNKVIDAMIEDMYKIDKLMSPYWISNNKEYSEIGYTCRENYFIKENK